MVTQRQISAAHQASIAGRGGTAEQRRAANEIARSILGERRDVSGLSGATQEEIRTIQAIAEGRITEGSGEYTPQRAAIAAQIRKGSPTILDTPQKIEAARQEAAERFTQQTAERLERRGATEQARALRSFGGQVQEKGVEQASKESFEALQAQQQPEPIIDVTPTQPEDPGFVFGYTPGILPGVGAAEPDVQQAFPPSVFAAIEQPERFVREPTPITARRQQGRTLDITLGSLFKKITGRGEIEFFTKEQRLAQRREAEIAAEKTFQERFKGVELKPLVARTEKQFLVERELMKQRGQEGILAKAGQQITEEGLLLFPARRQFAKSPVRATAQTFAASALIFGVLPEAEAVRRSATEVAIKKLGIQTAAKGIPASALRVSTFLVESQLSKEVLTIPSKAISLTKQEKASIKEFGKERFREEVFKARKAQFQEQKQRITDAPTFLGKAKGFGATVLEEFLPQIAPKTKFEESLQKSFKDPTLIEAAKTTEFIESGVTSIRLLQAEAFANIEGARTATVMGLDTTKKVAAIKPLRKRAFTLFKSRLSAGAIEGGIAVPVSLERRKKLTTKERLAATFGGAAFGAVAAGAFAGVVEAPLARVRGGERISGAIGAISDVPEAPGDIATPIITSQNIQQLGTRSVFVPTDIPSFTRTKRPKKVRVKAPTISSVTQPVKAPSPITEKTKVPIRDIVVPETAISIPTRTRTGVPSTIQAQVPVKVQTGVPVTVPTQVPALVPADVPADVPTDIVSKVPVDVPSQVPVDIQIPITTSVPVTVPTPKLPFIPFGGGGLGRKFGLGERGRRTRYTPSLGAVVFGITAKEVPFTAGIGARPIITGESISRELGMTPRRRKTKKKKRRK